MSPQREIVAGVTFKSELLSMTMEIVSLSFTDSPFGSESFLLSSSTELRFSTHTGSIGPSSTIHFLEILITRNSNT